MNDAGAEAQEVGSNEDNEERVSSHFTESQPENKPTSMIMENQTSPRNFSRPFRTVGIVTEALPKQKPASAGDAKGKWKENVLPSPQTMDQDTKVDYNPFKHPFRKIAKEPKETKLNYETDSGDAGDVENNNDLEEDGPERTEDDISLYPADDEDTEPEHDVPIPSITNIYTEDLDWWGFNILFRDNVAGPASGNRRLGPTGHRGSGDGDEPDNWHECYTKFVVVLVLVAWLWLLVSCSELERA